MDNVFDELIDDMVEENKKKEDQAKKEAEAKYHAEQKAKFKFHTFTSANKWYLIVGCFFALTAIMLEIIAFAYTPFVIGCFLQIPIIFAAILASTIVDFVKRRNFTIYFMRLSDNPDLKYIKEHYEIMDINSHAVIFVLHGDEDAYNSWKLLQGYSNSYKFEIDYFL